MKVVMRHGRTGAALALTAGVLGVVGLTSTPAFAVSQTQACTNSAQAGNTQIGADLVGNAPASVAPGDPVNVTGLQLDAALPGAIFVAGYNLGLLNNGQVIPGDVRAVIEATNTVEGSQQTNLATASIGPLQITDPDGVRGTGDETAVDAATSVTFADMAFTAGGSGTIQLREDSVPLGTNAGGIVINANLGFTSVQFRCSPGTVDAADVATFIDPGASFASTNIVTPPAAPVAADDSASVGATQSVSVNVVSNDSDVNGDLDPSTVTIVSGPSAGTAVANPDGTVTYTNTSTANSDSFTYTVADAGGRVSAPATVNVSILSGACDATAAACELDQIIEVQVNGAAMSMEQAGSLITLPPVTLNGQPQQTQGALNGLTVVNARGTDAGWSLTGQMTSDFSDGTGDGVCSVADPTTWDNHCIPGGNVGWGPTAQVSHTQIPGDVATVNAGAPAIPGTTGAPGSWDGLATPHTLCSAPVNRSGGTFDCGGAVGLGIPASAAAGLYTGTLTLTLV